MGPRVSAVPFLESLCAFFMLKYALCGAHFSDVEVKFGEAVQA